MILIGPLPPQSPLGRLYRQNLTSAYWTLLTHSPARCPSCASNPSRRCIDAQRDRKWVIAARPIDQVNPFSFPVTCSVLGLEPEAVRAAWRRLGLLG